MQMSFAVLIGILVRLLNGQTTAKQLSQQFEISQRSVYRYIETLCQSGVPIVSVFGKYGGFLIEKNFQAANLFFSVNEIDELILSTKNETLKQKLTLLKKGNKKEPKS